MDKCRKNDGKQFSKHHRWKETKANTMFSKQYYVNANILIILLLLTYGEDELKV